jgi:hypothetical protein
VYSSLDFSAWILIAVTLERVISAWLPHKARTLCTKKYAISLLIAIAVFILLLNAHLLYGMVFIYRLNENGVTIVEKCVEINADYRTFFNVSWPWIDFCAFCFIPFTVIVIGNALILFKVIKSQRKVQSRVVPSVQSGNRPVISSKHAGKQSSMTAMLFTLNVVFLVSTSPVSIYNIGYPYWSENASEHKFAQLDFWWAIVNMLMYMNNSLNFLLYCLSGTKFRLEVVRIFCSWRRGNNNGNLHRAAQSSYTRTKFDTPTATPSPRHSAIFTVNSSLSNSSQQINVDTPEMIQKSGMKTFKNSNKSLHPNDALKITSKTSLDLNDKSTNNTERKRHWLDGLNRKKVYRSCGDLKQDGTGNKEYMKQNDTTTDINNGSGIQTIRRKTTSASLNNILNHKESFLTDMTETGGRLTAENKSGRSRSGTTHSLNDSTV